MSRLRPLLHVAPLGNCNTQHDPLRVAEDNATRNATRNKARVIACCTLHTPTHATRNSRISRLRDSFDLVARAFRLTEQEVDLAWRLAMTDLDAAESAFHADAAMIRAGWRPCGELE